MHFSLLCREISQIAGARLMKVIMVRTLLNSFPHKSWHGDYKYGVVSALSFIVMLNGGDKSGSVVSDLIKWIIQPSRDPHSFYIITSLCLSCADCLKVAWWKHLVDWTVGRGAEADCCIAKTTLMFHSLVNSMYFSPITLHARYWLEIWGREWSGSSEGCCKAVMNSFEPNHDGDTE